eukprot:CFRG6771T1
MKETSVSRETKSTRIGLSAKSCQKFACLIQDCLASNDYQEDKCKAAILGTEFDKEEQIAHYSTATGEIKTVALPLIHSDVRNNISRCTSGGR